MSVRFDPTSPLAYSGCWKCPEYREEALLTLPRSRSQAVLELFDAENLEALGEMCRLRRRKPSSRDGSRPWPQISCR